MSSAHALESLIDFSCFVELTGSTDLICPVAIVFASQAALWLPDFQSAIVKDDPAPVLHLLHQMAGCCAAICALAVSRGLRDAEQAVLTHGVAPNREDLLALCDSVCLLNDALMAYSAAKTTRGRAPLDPTLG